RPAPPAPPPPPPSTPAPPALATPNADPGRPPPPAPATTAPPTTPLPHRLPSGRGHLASGALVPADAAQRYREHTHRVGQGQTVPGVRGDSGTGVQAQGPEVVAVLTGYDEVVGFVAVAAHDGEVARAGAHGGVGEVLRTGAAVAESGGGDHIRAPGGEVHVAPVQSELGGGALTRCPLRSRGDRPQI